MKAPSIIKFHFSEFKRVKRSKGFQNSLSLKFYSLYLFLAESLHPLTKTRTIMTITSASTKPPDIRKREIPRLLIRSFDPIRSSPTFSSAWASFDGRPIVSEAFFPISRSSIYYPNVILVSSLNIVRVYVG